MISGDDSLCSAEAAWDLVWPPPVAGEAAERPVPAAARADNCTWAPRRTLAAHRGS